MSGQLKGRVAMVTGGGRGLGRGIALELARAGARVAVVSRTLAQLEEVVAEITAAGGEAIAVVADVSDRDEVEAGVRETQQRLGPVSILVNNAGLAGPFGPIGVVDPDDWWRAQGVHVRGTLLFMHMLLPAMREQGTGCIVNIASKGGLLVGPNLSAYCVAKATVIRLTEHVDAEARADGIRAFVVQPGTILTDMARDSINDPEARKWVPFLVDDLKAIIDQDPTPQLERLGRQIVALASDAYNSLAGAYLDLEPDLEDSMAGRRILPDQGVAMHVFPDSPDYTGLNTPVGEEYDLATLEVEGEIPAEVEGTFFRAVPDPAFPPFTEDGGAILSGDGMISAIRFAGGKVSCAMRFVGTARHRAEVAAGRALFGKYRNPYTDRPEARGIDRTLANTTPVWHAGRLLLSKEDGRPYRVDPLTLETLGSYDFGGKLKSQTASAHVRIDPDSGEMFSFGYEAAGLASHKVSYFIVDRKGELVSEHWFDVPYCALMHDFAITKNYALFPVYPTICDAARLSVGGDHWVHEPHRESWVGVMPRGGDIAKMRWFQGPKGVFCFHILNAFEDAEGRIHLDQCLSDVNPFTFIQRASGLTVSPQEMNSRLARWTIDPGESPGSVHETVIGPPCDLPVKPAGFEGRPLSHAWVLSMNPEMQGPPVLGGPVGAMFNMLLRLDFTGGPPKAPAQTLALAANECFNEPVHVPAENPEHEGWLLTVINRQLGPEEFENFVWVLNAGDIAAGPVAKIKIPRRLRPQVHGWWVSAAELASLA